MRNSLIHSVIDPGILLLIDTYAGIIQCLNFINGSIRRKTVLDDDLEFGILLGKDVLHGLYKLVARI